MHEKLKERLRNVSSDTDNISIKNTILDSIDALNANTGILVSDKDDYAYVWAKFAAGALANTNIDSHEKYSISEAASALADKMLNEYKVRFGIKKR